VGEAIWTDSRGSEYYGVPLLVIPQAQDQFYVAKRVTHLKAGDMLFMQEVNAQRLRHAAGKILADLLYAQNSAKIGGTFHEAGGYMRAADAFVVNVAIPSISRGLRTSLSEVELVIASYILVYAVLLVTGGRLGDRFGHKRMFLLGVAGFTLASIGCALAPSVYWLIGARVLQGASAALLYPQALSILQVTFSGRERAVALGIYGSALPVAAVMGQVGGGLLIQANILGLTWRPVFLINVPIGILTLVAAALFLGGGTPLQVYGSMEQA
jgi:MFS family permease